MSGCNGVSDEHMEMIMDQIAEVGKMYKSRIGYMCKIDFDHELGTCSKPSKVFSDIESLIEEHDCANECGIVEVEVCLIKVVKESTF